MDWTTRLLRTVWTFFAGIILGWLTESYLIGGGLAAVSGKIIFGDLNRLDAIRWIPSFAEGVAGAALGRYFRVQDRVSQTVFDQVGVRVEELPMTLLSEVGV